MSDTVGWNITKTDDPKLPYHNIAIAVDRAFFSFLFFLEIVLVTLKFDDL